jgi:hypothetical protein
MKKIILGVLISLLLANVCYGASFLAIKESLYKLTKNIEGYSFEFELMKPGLSSLTEVKFVPIKEYKFNDHIRYLLDECPSRNLKQFYFAKVKNQAGEDFPQLVLFYGSDPIIFTLKKGRLEHLYFLLFILDDSNNTGASYLSKDDKISYCNLLLQHQTSIGDSSIYETFYSLEMMSRALKFLKDELRDFHALTLTGDSFDDWKKQYSISDEDVEDLQSFLDNEMTKIMTPENLFCLLRGKTGTQYSDIYNALKLDPKHTYFYDFENFDNYDNLVKVNNRLFDLAHIFENIRTRGDIKNELKIAREQIVPVLSCEGLTYTEYGGKIEVATVSVPIAVKPPGFFGQEFSSITPETIFDKIKGFLFDLAPYVFTLLLIIGGLLYLLTPVSDQIKKGSEVIKWAVIGYFLLLVITGVITLLKTVLGGP